MTIPDKNKILGAGGFPKANGDLSPLSDIRIPRAGLTGLFSGVDMGKGDSRTVAYKVYISNSGPVINPIASNDFYKQPEVIKDVEATVVDDKPKLLESSK